MGRDGWHDDRLRASVRLGRLASHVADRGVSRPSRLTQEPCGALRADSGDSHVVVIGGMALDVQVRPEAMHGTHVGQCLHGTPTPPHCASGSIS